MIHLEAWTRWRIFKLQNCVYFLLYFFDEEKRKKTNLPKQTNYWRKNAHFYFGNGRMFRFYVFSFLNQSDSFDFELTRISEPAVQPLNGSFVIVYGKNKRAFSWQPDRTVANTSATVCSELLKLSSFTEKNESQIKWRSHFFRKLWQLTRRNCVCMLKFDSSFQILNNIISHGYFSLFALILCLYRIPESYFQITYQM